MHETPRTGSEPSHPEGSAEDTVPALAAARDFAGGDTLEADLIAQRMRLRMFGEATEDTRVGRYVLVDRIGAGGMGVVYSAYDATLDRKVAIKFVHRHLCAQASTRERFVREAQAMARLSHPNVVQIHDAGDDDGRLFLALEFVVGGTLRTYLADHRQTMGWRETVALFRAAALGLAAAHDAGIVHRDFKPDNVLCPDAGGIKVADFGLAGLSDVTGHGTRSASHTSELDVTAPDGDASAIVGTPAYMAPEQHRGRGIDARADQFAFCVALFEALSGTHPFEGADAMSRAAAVLAGRRAPIEAGRVPPRLRKIVERGLAVDPAARWPSMQVLIAQLDRVTAPRARVGWLIAGGLAMATVVGIARVPVEVAADPCSDTTPAVAALEQTREQALARWATTWTTARREGCLAHHDGALSSELYERRNVCLDGALAAVQMRTALAGESIAASTLDHDEIDRCTDAVRLTAGPIPAGTGAARDAWVALREQIARADDAIDRGDVAAVDTIVAALGSPAHATALADTRLVDDLAAHGSWLRGRAARARGDLDAAVAALAGASAQADRAGDDELRARALVEAVWVTGVELFRADEARRLGELASGAIARAGVQARLDGPLHEGLGMTAMYQGSFDVAALELDRALVTTTSPRNRTTLHANLASVALRRGDAATAVESLQRALAELEDPAADRDPTTRSGVLNNLGYAQLAAGRPDAALVTHQQSLALREVAFGGESLEVANALGGVGLALVELDRNAEARIALERALAIRTAHGGRPEDLAEVQFGLARALASADPRAVELATTALAAYRQPALQGGFEREAATVAAWLSHHDAPGQAASSRPAASPSPLSPSPSGPSRTR